MTHFLSFFFLRDLRSDRSPSRDSGVVSCSWLLRRWCLRWWEGFFSDRYSSSSGSLELLLLLRLLLLSFFFFLSFFFLCFLASEDSGLSFLFALLFSAWLSLSSVTVKLNPSSLIYNVVNDRKTWDVWIVIQIMYLVKIGPVLLFFRQ